MNRSIHEITVPAFGYTFRAIGSSRAKSLVAAYKRQGITATSRLVAKAASKVKGARHV